MNIKLNKNEQNTMKKRCAKWLLCSIAASATAMCLMSTNVAALTLTKADLILSPPKLMLPAPIKVVFPLLYPAQFTCGFEAGLSAFQGDVSPDLGATVTSNRVTTPQYSTFLTLAAVKKRFKLSPR